MKIIVLWIFLVIGVSSDTLDGTSTLQLIPGSVRPLHLNGTVNRKISTSLNTKIVDTSGNRRDGVSYSTSVIHRDPSHPEKEAASSMNFHLNTDVKSTYDYNEQPSLTGYTAPKYQQFKQASPQSEDDSHIHGQYNIVYGKNAPSHSNLKIETNNRVPERALHEQNQHGHPQNVQQQHVHQQHVQHQTTAQIPSNHQAIYKPTFVQSTYTPSYKHSSNGGRTTTRPKTTPHGFKQVQANHIHGSHGSHSHNSHHMLPVPQAYTQAIYPKPEAVKLGKAISFSHQNQELNQHDSPGQTQSFNVGYSVKFANEPQGANQKKKPYKPIRLDSDIITGSHKEEVSKPSHLSQVTNHRFPGTKGQDDHKYFSGSANSPQQILSQAHLTQKTQKQLAFLENIESRKKVPKETTQQNFPWKILSPSVEIYRSKDVAVSTDSNPSFDHEKAIGKSEDFDYTNAVNYGNGNIVQIASHQNQGLHSIPGLNPELVTPQGHETQQVQVQAHLELQPQNSNDQIFLQTPDLGNSDALKNIPMVPKLPVDTSLLREPFLTVHKTQMHSNDAKLPILFDTTLIKGTHQAYGEIVSPESHDLPSLTYNNKLSQFNSLLAEQSQQHSYRQLPPITIPPPNYIPTNYKGLEHEHKGEEHVTSSIPPSNQDDMTFTFPQNALFNPIMAMVPKPIQNAPMPVLFTPQGNVKAIDSQLFKHLKMYKVKENVSDYAQPQQHKFKVFGKPGNGFMRHQFEKMRHEGIPVRTESTHFHQGPNKRLVREYTNIEMDLRPPPQSMPFKTANYLRIKQ